MSPEPHLPARDLDSDAVLYSFSINSHLHGRSHCPLTNESAAEPTPRNLQRRMQQTSAGSI